MYPRGRKQLRYQGTSGAEEVAKRQLRPGIAEEGSALSETG